MKLVLNISCVFCVLVFSGVGARPALEDLKEVYEAIVKKIEEVQQSRIDQFSRAKKFKDSCTAEYAKLPASTMCDYDDDPSVTTYGVSSAEQQTILAEHNRYRSDVNPPAANMQKMYWDKEIAKIAQKWANTCQQGHDKNIERQVPGYGISIGQNWAGGYDTWVEAVDGWHSEVKDFTYGASNSLGLVGHYTQVVGHQAAAVGCGYSICPNRSMKSNFVCNYAFGQMDINKPYDKGSSCAHCPDQCSDNQCDCGGTFCQNGGTMDLKQCKCICPDYATGRMCENFKCPIVDQSACGKQSPYGYPPEFCMKYANVMTDCPIMCGICDEVCPGKTEDSCQNGGSMKGDCTCKCTPDYAGEECEKFSSLKCGEDKPHCGKPYPYGYPPEYCTKYSNIPDECPHMCGKC